MVPPLSVRKELPGCSQKLHLYSPLYWMTFNADALAGKSKQAQMVYAFT